ncbi:MAG: hypothetical protein EYC71_00860 [Gammaproteobacteria bacterium]|nr:MAG: hypothetical protein EYC71_00860 [Gammaproteobacteria bacterium]
MNLCRCIFAVACLSVASLALAENPVRSVKPEDLEKYWVMMKDSVQGDAPLGGKNMNQPGCAAVSFIVEGNGRASNITIEKVYPEGGLGEFAANIAANLEFLPTIPNAGRDRVFSSMIFPFNLPADSAARTAVMQNCVIPARKWKPQRPVGR